MTAIRTLRVQLDVPADNAAGLSFLGFLFERANGRFDVKLMDVDADPAAGVTPAALRVDRLIVAALDRLTAAIDTTPGPLLAVLRHRASGVVDAKAFGEKFESFVRTTAGRSLGDVLRAEREALEAQERPPSPPLSTREEPPPPQTKPSAPLIGKTVAVDPMPAVDSPDRPMTHGQRLVVFLRGLRKSGEPMPGNKAIAEAIGLPVKQLTVLLTKLKAEEVVDYAWRPAPIEDDQSRQMRFVTKA